MITISSGGANEDHVDDGGGHGAQVHGLEKEEREKQKAQGKGET